MLEAAGTPEVAIAPIRAQIAAIQQQITPAGGDVVWRDKHVHGDDVAGDKVAGHKILATLQDGSQLIGGNVHGLTVITPNGLQVSLAPGDVPPETLLAAYYRSLAGEACRLPLGVIDVEYMRASGEHSPPLPDVYVDLDVVAPPPEKDAEGERGWALRMARGEEADRLPLLEALSRPEGHLAVLLGDAGSGKSTFVNYVAYQVASGKSGLPEDWRSPLVARFVLREVAARHIPAQARRGQAQMLWDALQEDMAGCLGQAGAERLLAHLQARLWQEGGLILLDGLDEVPAAGQRRKVLLEAVRDLAESLPAETTRILVTARPYAYADKAWRLPGFAALALAPFSAAQVQRFVDRWYQAVRPSMQWSAETAAGKGQALRAALDERPYLADLASRPLLLTLMATLHSSWGALPEDRAGLYEETVKLLLGRWQRAREVRGPDGELVVEQGISEMLGVGEERIGAALQDLAYTVHVRQRQDQDSQEGPADIDEGEVLVAFKSLLGTVDPDTLLGYLQERAGLLISRRERVYAFPHRSFQEYLAACHLADQPDFAEQVQRLAGEDPLWWREVALLAIGKARQGGLGSAVSLVNVLLPDGPEDVGAIEDVNWRVAVLAGLALQELRLAEKAQGQRHYAAVLKRARRWLVRLVEGGHLPARERLEAGDALGWLGDPRPGVATLVEDRSMPDIAWVEIPAGPFTMGTAEDDEMAWGDEKPAHTVDLPLYFIARYPLTNAQFRPFVEGDGYSNPEYWTEEGWAWRRGAEADLSVIEDANLRQGYEERLAKRPVEKRNRPFWWDDRRFGAPNRPVVGISWHEALAYTRWLDARLRSSGGQPRLANGRALSIPPGYCVALPSEAEWEKAARGVEGRRWPWGADWEAGRANSEETGLAQTSPVGLFPAGTGPFGLLDAAGNVWEWTRSKWGRRAHQADYGYPYDVRDGREVLSDPDWRIVRGGTWYDEPKRVRCAYCHGRLPDTFGYYGVRLVVSLANSGC
jgi:formylglycine-generating enzyme required for sulfatase activity